jgi:hypothetical protein
MSVLGLWVQIPPGTRISVSCECCELPGRGLCSRLITCPEESYQMQCVYVCLWSLDNDKALAYQGLQCHEKHNPCAMYHTQSSYYECHAILFGERLHKIHYNNVDMYPSSQV